MKAINNNSDNLKMGEKTGLGEVHVDGKVHKKGRTSSKVQLGKEEKAEMKEYLSKLQTIVPFMPKDKKLSKFEVISLTIDYIRELRVTLGLRDLEEEFPDHHNISDELTISTEASSQKSALLVSSSSPQSQLNLSDSGSNCSTSPPRQPLCVISTPRNTQSSNGSYCGTQPEGPSPISNKGIAAV